jgi:hypothetical protein
VRQNPFYRRSTYANIVGELVSGEVEDGAGVAATDQAHLRPRSLPDVRAVVDR